jgi:chromosome segregation ATPase
MRRNGNKVLILKKLFLCFLIGVCLTWTAFVLISCSSAGVAQLPSELATGTKDVVQQSKETEKNIYQRIYDNLETLRKLHAEVKTSANPLSLTDKVIRELERVTTDFESLASQREKITRDFLKQLQTLYNLASKAEQEMKRLQEEKANYMKQLAILVGTDPETLERKKAYKQVISYLDKRIEIWDKFLSTHKQIEAEVTKIEERIKRLITTIELTALVYRHGLETLRLQKDIQDAVALLSQIPELEILAQEMVKSWDTLDSLVNELLSFKF